MFLAEKLPPNWLGWRGGVCCEDLSALWGKLSLLLGWTVSVMETLLDQCAEIALTSPSGTSSVQHHQKRNAREESLIPAVLCHKWVYSFANQSFKLAEWYLWIRYVWTCFCIILMHAIWLGKAYLLPISEKKEMLWKWVKEQEERKRNCNHPNLQTGSWTCGMHKERKTVFVNFKWWE